MANKSLELKPHIPPYTTWPNGMASGIITVSAALAAVGTTLLILRIFTRFHLRGHKRLGWSLTFALASWSFAIPTSVLFALSAHYGLGNFYSTVQKSQLSRLLIYEWSAVALSMVAAWFGKVSALTYILDVQGPTHYRRKWFITTVVVINLIMYAIMIPVIFVQCNPRSSLWNNDARGDCSLGAGMRTFYLATVTGAWGAFTDLALAIYPSSLIWSLQMQVRMKIALSVLLGLGVFTAACAILKTILFCAFQATIVDDNATFDNAGFVFWSLIELWVILIAACIPALWPLFRRIAMKTDASGKRHWRLASSKDPSVSAEKGNGGGSGVGSNKISGSSSAGWSFRRGGSKNVSNGSNDSHDSQNNSNNRDWQRRGGKEAKSEKVGATILPISTDITTSQTGSRSRADYSCDGIWKGAASAGPGGMSPTKAEERSAARRYFHEYRSRPRGDPLGELGIICGIDGSELSLSQPPPATTTQGVSEGDRSQQQRGGSLADSLRRGAKGTANATTMTKTLTTTERVPPGTTVTIIP